VRLRVFVNLDVLGENAERVRTRGGRLRLARVACVERQRHDIRHVETMVVMSRVKAGWRCRLGIGLLGALGPVEHVPL
jgi:hypothetical protein